MNTDPGHWHRKCNPSFCEKLCELVGDPVKWGGREEIWVGALILLSVISC